MCDARDDAMKCRSWYHKKIKAFIEAKIKTTGSEIKLTAGIKNK